MLINLKQYRPIMILAFTQLHDVSLILIHNSSVKHWSLSELLNQDYFVIAFNNACECFVGVIRRELTRSPTRKI